MAAHTLPLLLLPALQCEVCLRQRTGLRAAISQVAGCHISAGASLHRRYAQPSEATTCKAAMDGRLFDGNTVRATYVGEEAYGRAAAGQWV